MWKWNMDLMNEIGSRADIFNNYWTKYFPNDEPETLYNAAKHIPFAGGKRLRPVLSMISCESICLEYNQVLPFAAALEIMHNFTLVHDDIMDNSKLRRNMPAAHIKYGIPAGILAGDYLFAKSFDALHDLNINLETLKSLEREFIRCIIDICEGQQWDVEFEKRKIVSEEEYIRMITKKTAVLFRLSSRGGAIIGGANQDEIEALTNYGLNLGLAFQIWDDYLDLSSDAETLGKDIGNDIRNGKKTLIAVHSLQNASGEQKEILNEIFGNLNASHEEVKKVFNVFRELGSVGYAKECAINYNNKAKEQISILKDSEAKNILNEIADYSIKREK